MINNNTVLIRIKNSGTFIAAVIFTFFFQGEIRTHTTPNINPGIEFTGSFPKESTHIHMFFHNRSAQGSPLFDEQVRPYAVNSCFLLTGDPQHPLCIPIPCSSVNSFNNCYSCRYF